MRRLSTISVRLVGVLAVAAVLGAFPFASTGSTGVAGSPSAGKVLMLDSVVNAPSEEAVSFSEVDAAGSLGLTVDVVTDQQWAALTAADFAKYKAIVFGDAGCANDDATALAAPLADTALWGPLVRGNVFVHTFDAHLHSSQDDAAAGARALQTKGIAYATAVTGKLGLYVSTSCYHGPTVARVLDGVESGWTFVPQGDWDHVDGNTVQVVGALPAELTGLTDSLLSNWGTSTHGLFSAWPKSVQVIALISARVSGGSAPAAGPGGNPQALDSDGCSCVKADAVTINGVTGSPVVLIRPALEDPAPPPVIEPTFTG